MFELLMTMDLLFLIMNAMYDRVYIYSYRKGKKIDSVRQADKKYEKKYVLSSNIHQQQKPFEVD